ncbi:hypothetical protein D1825_13760 [Cellulomonas rhizosphaerae]|uniref:Uncharacterized protein n=1 Tax=Cellulomonas rhizosphaerae TaxID=2293719 RepID=A0A413RJF0_9CELL|nr:hypothetical protein D1825_13760 [Cellulomonas rhizosphaerae]
MLVLPPVLGPGREVEAVGLLTTYFETPYTGASFEDLGRPWSTPETLDRVDAVDIVAVSTLSVDVPAKASIAILGELAPEIRALLSDIPAERDLVDADDDLIGPGSATVRLWNLLRELPGMGPTKASKLIARKRPRLVPIYDSVVKKEFGLKDARGYWHAMRGALRADDRALAHRATELRAAAGLSELVTDLRVVDVVTWMSGTTSTTR